MSAVTFQPKSPLAPDGAAEFFGRYASAVPRGSYDEAVDDNGMVRPHWRELADAFALIPPAEQAALAARLARLVHETGIAQDVFARPPAAGSAAPWSIDLIPLVVSQADWAHLSAGIVQRARLMDALLRDLYGPQQLLADGSVPAGLVYSDVAFLRPCRVPAGRGPMLAFYAADVARGSDGAWRVLDTHTETPAGPGFALANRIVTTAVTGDIFRRLRTERLANFFLKLQGELTARADHVNPRIVLLTPGPRHQDYFGHAYLARYLGLTLAEGGDCRVAGDRVAIKTLDGLKPVDLILRCVDGREADPLELSSGGYLGPVGLVGATRAAPGLVVNALGTGLAENRALGGFLPRLARTLLHEDLMLADAPRLWLGDPAAREAVLAQPEQYAIRAAHEGTGRPGGAAAGTDWQSIRLSDGAGFERRLRREAARLVAELPAGFSTVPSWREGALVPRPMAFRIFAARIGDDWQVLPGGIALEVGGGGVAMHAPAGVSRDVWVAGHGDRPLTPSPLRAALDGRGIRRGLGGITSRVADNLFWLGRYAERADWTMRLVRGALLRQHDDRAREAAPMLLRALTTLVADDETTPACPDPEAAPRVLDGFIGELLGDPKRRFGLPRTLDNLQFAAGIIRERLSVELWRTAQGFDALRLGGEGEPLANTAEALDALDGGIARIAALGGLAAENMTRSHGWTFLDLGRRIERARNVADGLGALFGQCTDESSDALAMLYILEVADSVLTYRGRYLAPPALPLVLDLLLADETNPRALAFQLGSAAAHLATLPQQGGTNADEGARPRVIELLTQVRCTAVDDLARIEADGSRLACAALMKELSAGVQQVSNVITRRYFSLTEDALHRVVSRPNPG